MSSIGIGVVFSNSVNIQGIIRPWRVTDVVSALSEGGVQGLTVSDVRGVGYQRGMSQPLELLITYHQIIHR